MTEPRRRPRCECVVGVSNKGRIAAGEFRSTEFTGWRSGWVVAVLDGDERPTRDGAGGGGGGEYT